MGLVADKLFLDKVRQLYTILNISHGVMIVGEPGIGKSSAWKVLFNALQRVEGQKGDYYIINPKALSKEKLYGTADITTREWTDGVFTSILRQIIDNVRGKRPRRQWIVFDGEVDPEWIENLNSVLDDNRMLTLPTGERLVVPPNVRIIFEVENLNQATPATISRCGMIWFPVGLVQPSMLLAQYMKALACIAVEETFVGVIDRPPTDISETQKNICAILEPFMKESGPVVAVVKECLQFQHLMPVIAVQLLGNFLSLLSSAIKAVLTYNATNAEFSMQDEDLENYLVRSLFVALAWSTTSSLDGPAKDKINRLIAVHSGIYFDPKAQCLTEYDVELPTGLYTHWSTFVPRIDLDSASILQSDVVIPTIDTLRREKTVYQWLNERRFVILCGPPGSGKTMTLLSALRRLPYINLVSLNFSSETTISVVMKALETACVYQRLSSGLLLSPQNPDKWVVLFCDEVNLPKPDKYGTQHVISLLRHIVEQGGFWKNNAWVRLERVQFVAACNPPTDVGRFPISNRLLRHCQIIHVEYPTVDALNTIYTTFGKAVLRECVNLRGFYEPLSNAMIDFYTKSKAQFTIAAQAHYVFSPRELTRWMRGVYEITRVADFVSLEDLVRCWAHEGLRLFQDRLVTPEEHAWTESLMLDVASKHFPNVDVSKCCATPILYSNFLSRRYAPVNRDDLSNFLLSRLQTFYEEELDAPIVLFDKALEHILRIDRVLRQPQGHMMLIGISGFGKTVLTRFVCWMNGVTFFQPSIHPNYTIADFDEDLRTILKRAALKNERICCMIDEATVKDSAFLEKLNTLLANSEVPELFEGDDHAALISSCREACQREGIPCDNSEVAYKWFVSQIMRNLHVVFTMNPPDEGLSSCVNASPALFNRCVLNWMGDWDQQALYQVGKEFVEKLDLSIPYNRPPRYVVSFPQYADTNPLADAVVDCMMLIHASVKDSVLETRRDGRQTVYVTPRQYLDFVEAFVKMFNAKKEQVEDRQRHLLVGLEKLDETVQQVEILRSSLRAKQVELASKTNLANEKLKVIVANQQDAETQKSASERIHTALVQQNKEIDARKQVVVEDLAKAEPAVVAAQESVSNIKRQHLNEMRSMVNPPEPVKITMEAVCILLGHRVDSWKSVQAVLRRDDFISSIVNYSTESLSKSTRSEVTKAYCSDPNFTFEVVDRASKACGPLYQWVTAQIAYADILEKVGPLRAEVQQLEAEAKENLQKDVDIKAVIKGLESNISVYTQEYSALISEIQLLKNEMDIVQRKVDRSISILDNISSEKSRWENASITFKKQIESLVGDVLLSSAFIAYSGAFDHEYRVRNLGLWTSCLAQAGIKYTKNISFSDYLSVVEERNWSVYGLPSDRVCVENAVIIEQSQSCPLLIDPAGQAVPYLQARFKTKGIVTTSFRDHSWKKMLETSVRFGNQIIIEDAEYYNPILDSILKKEVRRCGGRLLCKLGPKEIDYSPTFKLYLSTRDPNAQFSPELSARVCFVNFTITPASLQLQCLDRVMDHERPDIQSKRKDLLRLHGDYQMRLYRLEKELLHALNSAEGNILNDDEMMNRLETLKKEANEISHTIDQTDEVLEEANLIIVQYEPFAKTASLIYFAMDKLQRIQPFYVYSLEFYLLLFDELLRMGGKTARSANQLEAELLSFVFTSVSYGLKEEDIPVFAMLIARIKDLTLEDWMVDILISNWESRDAFVQDQASIFDVDTQQRLQVLLKHKPMQHLVESFKINASEWKHVMTAHDPERRFASLSQGFSSGSFPYLDLVRKKLEIALVVKCIRPDRLVEALALYFEQLFNATISIGEPENKISRILDVSFHSAPLWPIVLMSDKGYDVSHRVEALANAASQPLLSVAMGAKEAIQLAESSIAQCAAAGGWVLLKNAHLALEWLPELEQKLGSLKPVEPMKLFITCEYHKSIPASLLRRSRQAYFAPPTGIRLNMVDSMNIVSQSARTPPMEKSRVLVLLAWFHSVVIERTRYVPLGWSKHYDFNDSDLEMAVSVVGSWIEREASTRANLLPAKIPWKAIKRQIIDCIYGGKMDNKGDLDTLELLVTKLFDESMFAPNSILVDKVADYAAVKLPDGSVFSKFTEWLKQLEIDASPHWIGLGMSANAILKVQQVQDVSKKLQKLLYVTLISAKQSVE